MQAAVLRAVNTRLQIQSIEPWPLGPTEARVKVTATGVCHSDLHRLTGDIPADLPMILGHEACGVVLEVGGGVTRIRVGDRVVSTSNPECGRCWFCINGQPNLCETTANMRSKFGGRSADGTLLNVMAGLGTFRDEMNVDETMLVPVETNLPDEQVALLGCAVTTGVGSVLNTAAVTPGSAVAVIGCGGVGLACVQGNRIAGASRIIAIDPIESKRAAAMSLGATDCIDPTTTDPVEAIRSLTQGRGCDYAFEVVGSAATTMQARQMTRRGGTTVLVGAAPRTQTVTFSAWDLHIEGRIVGSSNGSCHVRRDIPRYLRLAETGQLNLNALVSRRIALEQINEAFDDLRAGEIVRSVVV
jgi:S-(hydroxymethyl)glutathione dehydrogenase / alcohol dehydrogenase